MPSLSLENTRRGTWKVHEKVGTIVKYGRKYHQYRVTCTVCSKIQIRDSTNLQPNSKSCPYCANTIRNVQRNGKKLNQPFTPPIDPYLILPAPPSVLANMKKPVNERWENKITTVKKSIYNTSEEKYMQKEWKDQMIQDQT